MGDDSQTTIPPDDPRRNLTVARPDEDQNLPHVAVVGNTYTILVSGEDTAGRYSLVDCYVLPGGGPPPHRHDFEEMFSILDGEIELTFRDAKLTAPAGTTVNIPANSPHSFSNVSGRPARLLLLCSPAGQEKFFMEIGDPVPTRTAPPPQIGEAEMAARAEKSKSLVSKYRTEFVQP